MALAACGEFHSVFLNGNGLVHAFGGNEQGQCGVCEYNDEDNNKIPQKLSFPVPICQIACGKEFTICIDTEGKAFGFGANQCGQLGIENGGNIKTIQQILSLPPVQLASCGDLHTMYLAVDGTVWGTGANYWGQLTLGHFEKQYTPIQSPFLKNIIAIECGNYFAIFQNEKGSLFVSGGNDMGQLGNAIKDKKNPKPIKISLSNIVSFACTSHRSFFLDSFGKVTSLGDKKMDLTSLPFIAKIFCTHNIVALIDNEDHLWVVNPGIKIYQLPEIDCVQLVSKGGNRLIIKDSSDQIWIHEGGSVERLDDKYQHILSCPSRQKSARK